MAENENPQQPMPVLEHVAMIIDQMAAISWQKLGLQHDIMTGKLERNLPEAKIAIDLVAHLAGILDSGLDAEDRRRVQGLVRDLRFNYVQQNKEVGT